MASKLKTVLTWVFAILAGGIMGAVLMHSLSEFVELNFAYNHTWIMLLIFIGTLLLCFLVQIALHELGHAVFGKLDGYKFVSYQVFGFLFKKENGKWKIRRQRIPGTLGQSVMDPPDDMENYRFIRYNLGGCIMNLVSGLAGMILGLFVPPSNFMRFFLFAFGLVGIASALANGIPSKANNGIENDGFNTLFLLTNARAPIGFWKQLRISALSSQGKRLNEMDDSLFEYDEEDLNDGMNAIIPELKGQRYLEIFDFQNSVKELNIAIDPKTALAPIQKSMAKIDLATCYLGLKETGKANKIIKDPQMIQVFAQMKKFPNVIRLQYLYGKINQNDSEKNLSLKREFDEIAKTWPNPNEIESEREIIGAVLKNNGME